MSADVAIIIPTYNEVNRLGQCLDALATQTIELERLFVMVVDNNSSDNIQHCVERYSFCHYLFEEQPGSYCARNKALNELPKSIKYIGFTDADCLPQPDWIENALQHLMKQPLQAIAGNVEVYVESQGQPSIVELYEVLRAFPQQFYAEQQHFGVTANLFTSRAVIDQVGSFNTSLYSGGDLEWGTRLKTASIPVNYASEVRVCHPARQRLEQLTRKIRRTVGGAYRQREELPECAALFRWTALIRGIIPPVKSLKKLASHPMGLTLAQKCRIFGLFTFLKWYQVAYRVKYLLGLQKADERL
ncbi:Glycosyltransferase AglI [Saliniradius amylolyticus]|uniref:Glycosyltransferase AglI n=2 Tax=Saliniradius amylolyticus TaxID=2183582 RepID=A0A2S2E0W8_9ALTE|nr:Glycosyltransferase AglI [Saliniradius amylolyticus]